MQRRTDPGSERAQRIDPGSDRARYRQLADILREQIRAGAIPSGELLPSVPRLQQQYDLGREAVRAALRVLRAEGLIETTSGIGSTVRDPGQTQTVKVQPGDLITTVMPTPLERRELGIPEGVPVLAVERDGHTTLYAGDRTALKVAREEDIS
jgi:DNA-binding transcriptional regulator YhcF (GntR family)